MSAGKRAGDLWPEASGGGGHNSFPSPVTEARAEQ